MNEQRSSSWASIYTGTYRNNLIAVLEKYSEIRLSYTELSVEVLDSFEKEFFVFFDETIELFQLFYKKSRLINLDKRLTVIYTLNQNILKTSHVFYDLYVESKERLKCRNKAFNLFSDDEIKNTLLEFKDFFDRQLDLEQKYVFN